MGESVARNLKDEEKLAKYFSKDVDGNDLAFVVEGKEIWLNRETLRRCSPVFEAMFTLEFKEKNQETVTLPNKKFDDVFEFVQCLLPCPILKKVTRLNFFILMPLADEYDVEELKERIDVFLLSFVDKVAAHVGSFLAILTSALEYKHNKIVQKCVVRMSKWPLERIPFVYNGELPVAIVPLILDHKVRRMEFENKRMEYENKRNENKELGLVCSV